MLPKAASATHDRTVSVSRRAETPNAGRSHARRNLPGPEREPHSGGDEHERGDSGAGMGGEEPDGGGHDERDPPARDLLGEQDDAEDRDGDEQGQEPLRPDDRAGQQGRRQRRTDERAGDRRRAGRAGQSTHERVEDRDEQGAEHGVADLGVDHHLRLVEAHDPARCEQRRIEDPVGRLGPERCRPLPRDRAPHRQVGGVVDRQQGPRHRRRDPRPDRRVQHRERGEETGSRRHRRDATRDPPNAVGGPTRAATIVARTTRGYSSVGRALPWHGRGQGFNSP